MHNLKTDPAFLLKLYSLKKERFSKVLQGED